MKETIETLTVMFAILTPLVYLLGWQFVLGALLLFAGGWVGVVAYRISR